MSDELFRKEALVDVESRWLGEIVLAGPPSRWLWLFFVLTLTAGTGLFLVLGQYTRRETVTGQLVPTSGLLNVTALASGTVAKLYVEDGQFIREGQLLMEVSSEKNTARLGAAHASINDRLAEKVERYRDDLIAQNSVSEHQLQTLRTRESLIQQQLAQIASQLTLQQEEIRSSQALLDRIQPLGGKGYISVFDIQRQQAVVRTARSRHSELIHAQLELRQQLITTQESMAKLPLEHSARRNDISRELANIAQAQVQNDMQSGNVLRAEGDGVVSALLVKPGQMVSVGQPMMSVLPADSRLEAQLLVPSRAIGFISRGNRVILRYDAFPYQKFGQQHGTVSNVSRSALTPGEQAALTGRIPPADQGPLYRVDVELDRQHVSVHGANEPIRAGMELQADVLIERRRLVEWLFEPVFGIQRRVSGRKPNG